MSNVNAPAGLTPINQNGQPFVGATMLVAFASGNSNNIFIGDPLIPAGGCDAWGVPYVTIATAGATNKVLGSFLGITDGPAKGGNAAFTVTRDLPIYRQASIANYGLISVSADQLYAIQEDGVGGAIAAANAGFSNGNLIAGSGGSTVTGLSSWMLDSSTVGSGNATYQVKVLGLLRSPGNAFGASATDLARYIVRLNLFALADGTVGY